MEGKEGRIWSHYGLLNRIKTYILSRGLGINLVAWTHGKIQCEQMILGWKYGYFGYLNNNNSKRGSSSFSGSGEPGPHWSLEWSQTTGHHLPQGHHHLLPPGLCSGAKPSQKFITTFNRELVFEITGNIGSSLLAFKVATCWGLYCVIKKLGKCSPQFINHSSVLCLRGDSWLWLEGTYWAGTGGVLGTCAAELSISHTSALCPARLPGQTCRPVTTACGLLSHARRWAGLLEHIPVCAECQVWVAAERAWVWTWACRPHLRIAALSDRCTWTPHRLPICYETMVTIAHLQGAVLPRSLASDMKEIISGARKGSLITENISAFMHWGLPRSNSSDMVCFCLFLRVCN